MTFCDEGKPFSIPLLALLSLHCNGGADPTPTTGVTAATFTSGPSGSGGASDPTEGGATHGPTDASASAGETDGPGAHPPCERYLACIAATTPELLPSAQAGFGEDGTCWQGSPADAALCVDACRTGLENAHQAYPDEPACAVCGHDADCDPADDTLCSAAGECVQRCVDGLPLFMCECRVDADCGPGGACVDDACKLPAGCGNGVVEDGEVCDGQDGCFADCSGPPACSPLFDAGCPEGQMCFLDGYDAYCGDPPAGAGGFMDPCDLYDDGYDTDTGGGADCGPGLACSLCDNYEGCCLPFCAAGGAPCPNGLTCDVTGYPPPLDYLGLCRP